MAVVAGSMACVHMDPLEWLPGAPAGEHHTGSFDERFFSLEMRRF